VELYPHSPNTPSWCGAPLKHRDMFTFTFTFIVIHLLMYYNNLSNKTTSVTRLGTSINRCIDNRGKNGITLTTPSFSLKLGKY
jgi:hypothetical protein